MRLFVSRMPIEYQLMSRIRHFATNLECNCFLIPALRKSEHPLEASYLFTLTLISVADLPVLMRNKNRNRINESLLPNTDVLSVPEKSVCF